VTVTFPGKYGDLLWALPTIRALSRRLGEPVTLLIASPFGSITRLLSAQPYIHLCAAVDDWAVQDTAPMTPRAPALFDTIPGVIHLGYRSWPLPNVCLHTAETALLELQPSWGHVAPFTLAELDLSTPWIQVPPKFAPYTWDWVYGFTDEYFELKFGIVSLLEYGRFRRHYIPATGIGRQVRWMAEAFTPGTSWEDAAAILQHSRAFLGCNSALHVLAIATGCPVVMVEPQEMRHNAVFFPVGSTGPQVILVLGSDGRPTFDARHVADTLEAVIASRSATPVRKD
jgi:hypothetical protein